MKLKEILDELHDDIICQKENLDDDDYQKQIDKSINQTISQIRKELEGIVKKSHGWTDFKKNLDKFCEEKK